MSSDYRSPDSVSTTDFNFRLSVPIKDVVKTDLIQVGMDYTIKNIGYPDQMFDIGDGLGAGKKSTIVIPDGQYDIVSLAALLQQQLVLKLGTGITVYYDFEKRLIIELKITNEDDSVTADRLIACTRPVLSYILGLSPTPPADDQGRLDTLYPVYEDGNGEFGTWRWAFPHPTKLPGNFPYLMIQSFALGAPIRTAKGTTGYWRMIVNDSKNSKITTANSRVDTFLDVPITLHNIDIRIVNPDGTIVNNFGGRVTLLVEIVRLVSR